MSLLVVGSVAFDAIETPFGKTDKIIGGAASYISLAASYFTQTSKLVAVVGEDFPNDFIQTLKTRALIPKAYKLNKGKNPFFGVASTTLI